MQAITDRLYSGYEREFITIRNMYVLLRVLFILFPYDAPTNYYGHVPCKHSVD